MKTKYLFGYGSLVSRESIKYTLGRDPGEIFAAKLRGWIRDWSVVVDNFATVHRFELLPTHEIPHYVAALNIRKAAENETSTQPNGVLFGVTDEDIAKMDQRESCYIREEVTNDVIGAPRTDAIVYVYTGKKECCVQPSDKREIIVPKSYLDLVERSFDPEQLAVFHKTTLPTSIPVLDTIHTSGVRGDRALFSDFATPPPAYKAVK